MARTRNHVSDAHEAEIAVESDHNFYGPPPLGPGPSWTLSPFESDEWLLNDKERYPLALKFETIPVDFRYLAKHFLWALEYTSDTRLARLRMIRPLSFYTYFIEFRWLALELSRRNIRYLSQLTKVEIEDIFFKRLASIIDSSGGILYSSYCKVFFLFKKLHLLGPAVIGATPDGLRDAPTFKVLPPKTHLKDHGQTAIMPDRVAVNTYNAAMSFLDLSDAILLLYRVEREVSKRLGKDGESWSTRWKRAAAERRSYIVEHSLLNDVERALSTLGEQKKLLVLMSAGSKIVDDPLSMLDRFSSKTLNPLLKLLMASCYCVIAGFTGFRYNEIASIRRGDVALRGARAVIKTRITKTMRLPDGAEVDRFGPPIVAKAYEAMQAFSKLRSPGDSRLWCTVEGGLISNTFINEILNEFVNRIVGADWKIKTHQFRRYFAIFYVRRFQGCKDALRMQFRHVTNDMIEYYTKDEYGARYLSEAKRDLVHTIIDDLVFDRKMYRSIGKTIPELEMAAYRAANLPLEEIEKRLEVLARTSFCDIRPTLWGYCVVQKHNTSGAMCQIEGMPSSIGMYPENCGRCRHLVVGVENVPIWERTAEVHQQVIDDPTSPPLARAASQIGVREALDIIAGLSLAGEGM